MTRHRTLSQIFVGPLLVAVLAAAGLITALIGDGPWDAFSWLALGFPIVLCVFFLRRGRSR